jgi:uncharacterized protein YuzE
MNKINKIIQHYDEEFDSIIFNWGKTKHSREILNGKVVIDFDSKDNIVGIEIFDFDKELDKSQKEIDRIFKLSDKVRKKK